MLSTPEVQKSLKSVAKTGNWFVTKHAQERMLQRGFTAPDIERALRSGVHCPTLDELKDCVWRYRILSRLACGREIQLAVIIEDAVVVVTVIGK